MGFKKFLLGESWPYRVLVVIYLVFIFSIVILSAPIFRNLHSFTNISNSMNPAINTGCITVVRKFPSYQIGDVIAYRAGDNSPEIITHRIMSIGGNVYTTKGDANQVYDREIVLPRLVIGKVVFIIPYLGYLITFTKSQPGTFFLVILPAVYIILIESAKIFRSFKS